MPGDHHVALKYEARMFKNEKPETTKPKKFNWKNYGTFEPSPKKQAQPQQSAATRRRKSGI